jgi:hypothetical protein
MDDDLRAELGKLADLLESAGPPFDQDDIARKIRELARHPEPAAPSAFGYVNEQKIERVCDLCGVSFTGTEHACASLVWENCDCPPQPAAPSAFGPVNEEKVERVCDLCGAAFTGTQQHV